MKYLPNSVVTMLRRLEVQTFHSLWKSGFRKCISVGEVVARSRGSDRHCTHCLLFSLRLYLSSPSILPVFLIVYFFNYTKTNEIISIPRMYGFIYREKLCELTVLVVCFGVSGTLFFFYVCKKICRIFVE
jgi:hypothetical protein